MNSFHSVGYFLVTTFFSLFTLILWSRLFLRYFAMSYLSQISHGIYQLTDPLIKPIQQNLLHKFGKQGPYDYACLIVLLITELLKFTLLTLLFFKEAFSVFNLFLYSLTDLLITPCNIFFYAILIRVVMSWVNPHWRNPLANLIFAVTEPLLKTIHRRLPAGPLDFSPLIALVGLKVVEILLLELLPYPML